MKKKTKYIRKKLFPCNISFNDISELYNLLKDDCKKITFETSDYEATENLNDIENISTKNLYINFYFKNEKYSLADVQLDFTANGTEITAHNDSIEYIGLINKIEIFLKLKQNYFKIFFINDKVYYILLLFSLFIPMYNGTENITVSIFILFLWILYLVIGYKISTRFYNKLYLNKEQNNSFIRKIIKEIPSAIIQIVVGAILLFVGMYLGERKNNTNIKEEVDKALNEKTIRISKEFLDKFNFIDNNNTNKTEERNE